MAEEFDAFGASEAATLRTITYYLTDEEKEFHEENMSDMDDELDGENVDSQYSSVFVLFSFHISPFNSLSTSDVLSSGVNSPGFYVSIFKF